MQMPNLQPETPANVGRILSITVHEDSLKDFDIEKMDKFEITVVREHYVVVYQFETKCIELTAKTN